MGRLFSAVKHLSVSDRLLRRNPLLHGAALRLLKEDARDDGEARRRWRAARLQRVLSQAARTPYGRRIGAPQRLGDWPVLQKDAVRACPEDFLALPRWRSVSATTSGTSGTPLVLRRSWSSVAYEQAVLDWLMLQGGVDPGRSRVAVLRGDDVKDPADRSPPYWRLAGGGQRLVFSSNHLEPDTVAHFVAALRRFAPQVLFAYPTALDSLCCLMLERGDELQVPLTLCGSEMLTRETCRLAAQALQTRVLGYYGQAERVAWAWGDPFQGWCFLPSYSVNELQPLERSPEGDLHTIIGTGLWNAAMPLVRYETGDQIRVAPGSDPVAIAEGRERFPAIIGRSGDYLVSPSGARLIAINHIPRDVPHVVRTQFIQESADSVRILVVPAPGFDERSRRLLEEHASLKFPPSMRLHIETTTQLVRTAAGKAPLIVRRGACAPTA